MMKSQIIVSVLLVVVAFVPLGQSQLTCDKRFGPCICEGTGFIGVDITSALKKSIKNPVKDPSKSLKYEYPIDFCNGRTCKNDKKGGQDAALWDYYRHHNRIGYPSACQIDDTQNVSTKLGDIKQYKWQVFRNDTFAVKFSGGDKTANGERFAMLYIIRTNNSSRTGIIFNQVSFDEERVEPAGTDHTYVFSVYIKAGGRGSIVGPIGLTLIFLAIAALIAYFIIGTIILYKVKDKRGIEAIPNSTFWMSLPLLIKDGFMFTISPCLKLADHHSKSSYQSL